MINNLLKNICLIIFALIGPITLPAGGIQRDFNSNEFTNNSKEIFLSANCSLFAFPKTNAKKLVEINSGSTLSILRKWKVKEGDVWVRVQLATNQLIENPNKITRGWIKI